MPHDPIAPDHDHTFMCHALRLAARGLGNTWPNPAVGAVVVKDGNIIGRGWTARGGRPHAETIALTQAGDAARCAELYVTLEPCAHQGSTPPCTQAVIAAGIKRVIAACTDPNPLVSGKGFDQLRAANIEVTENVCRQEAEKINEGFFSAITRKRPFVTLKIATSLDGKIAFADGSSKWITSEPARKTGHLLRATHDVLLTGIGTVIADNPHMNCRLPGREHDSPQRAILDSQMRITPDAAILPAWIFTTKVAADRESEKTAELANKGSRIFTVNSEKDNSFLSVTEILSQLSQEGVTRLMVEGGSSLTTAFIGQVLADRIYWFRAPSFIGEGGLSALKGASLVAPPDQHYRLMETRPIGNDVLEIYDLHHY